MKTVVSERGQIVIPKTIRDRLGLRPGQILECREVRGRLVTEKASRTDADPVARAYSILRTPRRTNEWLDLLRGKPR